MRVKKYKLSGIYSVGKFCFKNYFGIYIVSERQYVDGLPIPLYKIYNIGNNRPENLLDFVNILAEELIKVDILPKDFDIEISGNTKRGCTYYICRH